jgi:diadenosine tetraphosphate (Ap4A) HIT family hydrolase
MNILFHMFNSIEVNMEKNINCVFCCPNRKLEIWDSKNFFALFDPYPLMEGHVMIAAKEHYGCAGELTEELFGELSALKAKITSLVKNAYGNVSFYEHGRAGGCMSTDPGNRLCHHFHLHALPFKGSLSQTLSNEFKAKDIHNYSTIKAYFEGYGEYLYFEDAEGKAHFYPVNNKEIPSHYLRTLVAENIGKPHRADWEQYAHHKEKYLIFKTEKIRRNFGALSSSLIRN